MKSLIVLLLSVLFLAACSAPPEQAVIAVTPKPTRTASAVPTPAPDYQATEAVYIKALDKLKSEQATQQAKIDAQARLSVDATLTHENGLLVIAAYTAEVARATLTAAPTTIPLTQTQQVIDDLRYFAGITAAAGRATQTAEYPAIIERRARAEASAKLAPVREATQSLTWPLVILCGTALMGYVIHKWARPIPFDTNEMDPQPVIVQETKKSGASLEVMQYEVPAFLTRELLCQVAAAITGGAPFSRSGLVDSHILTDGEWDSFRWWANRRGYAKPVRGDVENSPWYVTGKGTAFFQAFDLSPT